MALKQRYEGVIEEWADESRLYVPALPGFIAASPTREDLIEQSLPALDLHLAWLEGHGYPPALEDEGGLFVAEDLPANGAAGPLFTADLMVPNVDAIELALALGRVALSDAIDLVDSLEEAGV